MAGVYVQLGSDSQSRLWTLYMRIYELLWKLPKGKLANGECDARLNQDAQLGARLIRSYAKDWLDGGGPVRRALPAVHHGGRREAAVHACWPSGAIRAAPAAAAFPTGWSKSTTRSSTAPFIRPEDPDLSGIDDLLGDDGQGRGPHAGRALRPQDGKELPPAVRVRRGAQGGRRRSGRARDHRPLLPRNGRCRT